MTDFVPIQYFQPKIAQIQLFNHVLQNFDAGKGFRNWVFMDPCDGIERQIYVIEDGCYKRSTPGEIRRDVNNWLEKLDPQSHLYKMGSRTRTSLTDYIVLNSTRTDKLNTVKNTSCFRIGLVANKQQILI